MKRFMNLMQKFTGQDNLLYGYIFVLFILVYSLLVFLQTNVPAFM